LLLRPWKRTSAMLAMATAKILDDVRAGARG
jgi:hypothetical protein